MDPVGIEGNADEHARSLARVRFYSGGALVEPHSLVDASQPQPTRGVPAGFEPDAVVDDLELDRLSRSRQSDADGARARVPGRCS